jgi:hypothetical protein
MIIYHRVHRVTQAKQFHGEGTSPLKAVKALSSLSTIAGRESLATVEGPQGKNI